MSSSEIDARTFRWKFIIWKGLSSDKDFKFYSTAIFIHVSVSFKGGGLVDYIIEMYDDPLMACYRHFTFNIPKSFFHIYVNGF